jgi:hypothetical protein
MSQSRKFVPPLAVACALFAALGLTLVSSKAAQLGVQPVSDYTTFDKREIRAPNLATQRTPNLATQRTVGVANNLNAKRNISKGISPDG